MKLLVISLNSICSAEIPLLVLKHVRQLGHTAVLVTPLFGEAVGPVTRARNLWRGYTDPGYRRSIGHKILALARREPPDAVLLIGSNFYVEAEILWLLKRRYRCKVALWEQNMLWHERWQCESIPCYDGIVIMDEYLIPFMKNGFCKPFFVMGGQVDTEETRAVCLTEREQEKLGADVCFTGTVMGNRVQWLETLCGFDLKVWGAAYASLPSRLAAAMQPRPMYGLLKNKIYSASKIMVNKCLATNQVQGFGVKALEALVCGCLPCIEYNSDVERYLVPDREVVVYRSDMEMVDKIRYYLEHDEERIAIIRKGRERVEREWTYERKVPELCAWLGTL